jgi:hypothetical protein
MGVGADYVYSFYPTYHTNTTANTLTSVCDAVSGCSSVASTVTNSTKTSLSDQQVMAKITYHFA